MTARTARGRRRGAAALSCLGALFHAGPALAHGSERGFVLLLPTEYYLAGGAFAVAASFLLLALVPPRRVEQLAGRSLPLVDLPALPAAATSLFSFVFLCCVVLTGFYGSTDPLANPLPLFVWTLWWVGIALLHTCVGNLWALINPWTGPLTLVRGISRGRLGAKALLRLPERLGYLPAIVTFLGFAWFELVDLAPSDPTRLAVAVSAYWAATLLAMIAFGEQAWRARGEPFSIFFRLIGGMSPLAWRASTAPGGGWRRVHVSLRWPGWTLLENQPLPPTGILFVLLTLAAVSFDGFSKTFTWLSLIGINPLEFPGRSAVQYTNTAGLLAAFALLSGGFYAVVFLGSALIGKTEHAARAAGLLVYSVVPIAIAFHAAHYLTNFLVDAQFALVAFSDPFYREWDLLGIGHYHVTTSFLKNLDDVTLIWNAQTLIICAGHIVGIVLAHVIALRCFGEIRAALSSQFGLASLMVAYTCFGLWLLSTPTGA